MVSRMAKPEEVSNLLNFNLFKVVILEYRAENTMHDFHILHFSHYFLYQF